MPGSSDLGTLECVQPEWNMKIIRSAPPLPLAALILASLFSLSGCDIVDSGDPESARVEISGAEGESFQLITTSDFEILVSQEGDGSEVYVNAADTASVSSPLSNRYSLGTGLRFYMKAYSEEGLSEPITVKVYIDGDMRYNSSSTLDGLTLEFVYTVR